MNNIKNLKNKQLKAIELVQKYKNILLTGSAGTGKSVVIETIRNIYKNSRIVAVTSTTGTSAVNINGTTLHSYFCIGIGDKDVKYMIKHIMNTKWLKLRWEKLDCLIIDEISMLNPDLFDKLEEVARITRNNNKPFGGIQLVLSGDFCQIPVIGGTGKFCFEATSWEKCIDDIVYLDEIIRQNDKVFQDVLNNIRLGNITEEVKSVLNKRIGVELKNNYNIKPTKLFSLNRDVDRINELELDKLANEGQQFIEYELNTIFYKNVQNEQKIINKYIKNINCKQNLQLCIGVQVMLLKNIDLENGLANGSRGIVIDFVKDKPLVRFINGELRLIDYAIWEIEENNRKILRFEQIPLKVAYAISIHKSQGYTLDCIEIDLFNIFEYGQAYVALSRVKNIEGLNIINIDYDCIQTHPSAISFYNSIK